MKLSEIIAAWENGETIEQQRSNGDWSEWAPFSKYQSGCRGFDIEDTALAFVENKLRIEPRTQTINGIEFPEPVRKKVEYRRGIFSSRYH